MSIPIQCIKCGKLLPGVDDETAGCIMTVDLLGRQVEPSKYYCSTCWGKLPNRSRTMGGGPLVTSKPHFFTQANAQHMLEALRAIAQRCLLVNDDEGELVEDAMVRVAQQAIVRAHKQQRGGEE